ncbi:alpha/beta-hydrolase [Panus rudis PR-1116 ss-1]|nr:alpha/beta-hydrolase [Panus rudis PR-1116 ss-1]
MQEMSLSMIRLSCLLVACSTIPPLVSATATTSQSPTIQLDDGTFTGFSDGTSNAFLNIPFAQPPIGDLRFRRPVKNKPYSGLYNATAFGPICPQQAAGYTFPSTLEPNVTQLLQEFFAAQPNTTLPSAEDCLSVNVWTPADAKPGSRLPIVFWIPGGGFEIGGSPGFDGAAIVNKSVEIDMPVIYVSMNYRVNAFGFIGGKEVKEAGVSNLGLHDQRQALRWVQKYIHHFGGDPKRVILMGESAGAVCVAYQMLGYRGDTEGLFHGAFMGSGSPLPAADVSSAQKYYDMLVVGTNCTGANDTLQCLREVPYDELLNAINQTPGVFGYQSLNIAWMPWTDGDLLAEEPFRQVSKGEVAHIPFISGNCDDEGTLFGLSTLNLSTDAQVYKYLSTNYFPHANQFAVEKLMSLYPSDPADGCPFNTSTQFALTPQYKRMSAFSGDFGFHGPRRFLMREISDKQSSWAYLTKRFKAAGSFTGARHGTDLNILYGGGDLSEYLVNFINHLDPNGASPSLTQWPKYDTESQVILTLLDDDTPSPQPTTKVLAKDDYREESIAFLVELLAENPIGA